MTDKPIYYIAQSYQRFRAYCQQNKISVSDRYFIPPDRKERLMGLYLSAEQFVVIDDASMPYSFWVQMQAQIRVANVG